MKIEKLEKALESLRDYNKSAIKEFERLQSIGDKRKAKWHLENVILRADKILNKMEDLYVSISKTYKF